METKKIFSIVVPVCQNESNLDDTITKLLSLREKLPEYRLELVFVDDGSRDSSYEILLRYYRCFKDTMNIVKLTRNFGQIPALQAGLHFAKGDCVGIISADLQDPYLLFVDMIRRWEQGVMLVAAAREGRPENIFHRFLSNFYWRMVHRFGVKGYPLGGFDFCLIDRKIVADLNRINEKDIHTFMLIFSLGYKYELIPYVRQKRVGGKSQWGFFKKVKLAIDSFVAFTYLPIRAVTFLGLVISLAGFLYAMGMVVNTIWFGNPYTGWTTIVVLTTLFGGLILVTLGIIGEYIWRMLEEVRKRPNYVVETLLANDKNQQ